MKRIIVLFVLAALACSAGAYAQTANVNVQKLIAFAKSGASCGDQCFWKLSGQSGAQYVDGWGTVFLNGYGTAATQAYFDLNSDGILDAVVSMDTSKDSSARYNTAYNIVKKHFDGTDVITRERFLQVIDSGQAPAFIGPVYLFDKLSGNALQRRMDFSTKEYSSAAPTLQGPLTTEYLREADSFLNPPQELAQTVPQAQKTEAAGKTPAMQVLIDYAKSNADKDISARLGIGRYYAKVTNNLALWYLPHMGASGSDHIAIIRFRKGYAEIYFDWEADGNLDADVQFPFGTTFDPTRMEYFYNNFKRYAQNPFTQSDFNSVLEDSGKMFKMKDETVIFITRPTTGNPQLQAVDFKNKVMGPLFGPDEVSGISTLYLNEISVDAKYISSLKATVKKTASLLDVIKGIFGIA